MLFALLWLYNGGIANLFDKAKTHIRNGGCTVQPALLLHLADNMLYCFLFVLAELQLLQNELVTLGHLCSSKAQRYAGIRSVIFNKVHYTVQASMHCAAVIACVAEILTARPLLVFCHMERMGDKLVNTLIFSRGDGHNRDAKHGFHLIDADGASVLAHLVHHVQRQNHGLIQFHELHGKIQVPLNICCVHDIDNTARVLLEDKISRDKLLAGVGRHGIYAGQIGHKGIGPALDRPVLAVYRNTRKVADMLV